MKPRNLIIARSGEKSLHMNWLKGTEPNFDLAVTFYGNQIPHNWCETDKYYEITNIKGSKWKGLHKYLSSTNSWLNYDYILFPDDDLLCSAQELNALFENAYMLNADLCQPALDRNSYFSHPITLKHGSFNYRYTNFTELMIPCFSRRMLQTTIDLFTLTESGWGMDLYWWELIQKNNFNHPIIFDDINITHTRPVGAAKNGTTGNGPSPQDDLLKFMNLLAFSEKPKINIGGKIRNSNIIESHGNISSKFEQALIHDIILMTGQLNPINQTNYIIQQINSFQSSVN